MEIQLKQYSENMDEIIISPIKLWNEIKIERYNTENGQYYVSTNIVKDELCFDL